MWSRWIRFCLPDSYSLCTIMCVRLYNGSRSTTLQHSCPPLLKMVFIPHILALLPSVIALGLATDVNAGVGMVKAGIRLDVRASDIVAVVMLDILGSDLLKFAARGITISVLLTDMITAIASLNMTLADVQALASSNNTDAISTLNCVNTYTIPAIQCLTEISHETYMIVLGGTGAKDSQAAGSSPLADIDAALKAVDTQRSSLGGCTEQIREHNNEP
ncbi:hypothetical protein MVEN_00172500 [Mycena venus]|uniref:Uncharacterized protein n=1 Tax=Mycena venus TaxID=2733690 RepID=A0A8H6YWP9_9AGAR|nr:hypothetical protein MVEN_00172500 [Mycena venus]